MRRRADDVSGLMKALANPARLMVLCEMLGGEQSVGALERSVGLSQSALSQHLARLRADGLVQTRREAQTIYYSVADAKVGRLLTVLHDLYCGPVRETRAKGARS